MAGGSALKGWASIVGPDANIGRVAERAGVTVWGIGYLSVSLVHRSR
jgi:hypothetical protein